MADQPLFHLGGAWWLCHDRLQWMLSKAFVSSKQPQEAVLSTATERLRPRAFIASGKDTLLRVATEKELPLTAEARAKIDAFPDTFRQWHRRHKGRKPKAATLHLNWAA